MASANFQGIVFDERGLKELTEDSKAKRWSFEKWKFWWEKDCVKIETQTSVKDLEIKSYSIQITWKVYHIEERFDLFFKTPEDRKRPYVWSFFFKVHFESV